MAQVQAYALSARYAALFDQARRLRGMKQPAPDDPFLLDVDDPRHPLHIAPWKLEQSPTGFTLATEGDSDKEHAKAVEVLRVLMGAQPLPKPSLPVDAPLRGRASASRDKVGITVGEAARKYLLTLDSSLLPDKTRSQKKAAVNGFAQWRGLKHPLTECSRIDVAEWVQSLRASELATPTIANKASYLKACFAWLQAAGHYPMGDNPASGQVKFGVREKRLRRKLGFEAFSEEQLRVIFSSESLANLKEPVRWGAWLGLYSGARVSEIGQLRLDDFYEEDGVPCFRITAGGIGQSLKTDASERVVPLHPELMQMGLMEYIEKLRKAGKDRLFPRSKVGSVNGAGNFLSAAFGRHLTALGVNAKVGKVGFHSLRKTVIQSLQAAGVASEVRAQLVGHLLNDEHHATYSRRYTVAELAERVFPALANWKQA
jgi:integrase